MAKKKKTGYFIEDNPDIMKRLANGEATVADQKLIAVALEQADIYEDVYNNCTDKIEPYVERVTRPDGDLPASLCDSVDVLLEFWLANKDNPACKPELMKAVRKGLEVGAQYRISACETALAKLDSVTTGTIIQRSSIASRDMRSANPGFPTRLREAREAAGFSQRELAYKITTTADIIERYERGVVMPQPRTIRRIVNALKNVTLEHLLKGPQPSRAICVSSGMKHSVDEETE